MAIIPSANTKVGNFSLGEAVVVGAMKSVSEQLQGQFIGNGTYLSGAIKLVEAYTIPKYVLKNKMGNNLGTALAIDGVEDVLNALFSGGSVIDSTKGQSVI